MVDIDELISGMGKMGGRRGEAIFVGETRPITADDLHEFAEQERVLPDQTLKSLRATHHTIARLLCDGVSQAEISVIVGVSQSRISILKNDPAFAELLAHYAATKARVQVDMWARLAQLGVSSIEVLEERVLDNPDLIDSQTLLKIVEAVSDRTGFPKQTNINVKTTNISDATLEALKQEVATGVKKITSEDRATLLREIRGATESYPQSQELEGPERSGGSVRKEGDQGIVIEIENPLGLKSGVSSVD